jgi:hypothetical protein
VKRPRHPHTRNRPQRCSKSGQLEVSVSEATTPRGRCQVYSGFGTVFLQHRELVGQTAARVTGTEFHPTPSAIHPSNHAKCPFFLSFWRGHVKSRVERENVVGRSNRTKGMSGNRNIHSRSRNRHASNLSSLRGCATRRNPFSFPEVLRRMRRQPPDGN